MLKFWLVKIKLKYFKMAKEEKAKIKSSISVSEESDRLNQHWDLEILLLLGHLVKIALVLI